jgi:hypothetical protein
MPETDSESEHEQDESQLDVTTAEPTQSAKLDLSKYRTGELAAQIIELISVKGAIKRLGGSTIIMEFVVMLTVGALFYFSNLSYIWWVFLGGYCLAAGFLFGMALGFLRIVSAALRNIEAILRINLQIARSAVADGADLYDGKTEPPSGGELIEQVHDEIIWPVIEEVIGGTLGMLGKPLIWVY